MYNLKYKIKKICLPIKIRVIPIYATSLSPSFPSSPLGFLSSSAPSINIRLSLTLPFIPFYTR